MKIYSLRIAIVFLQIAFLLGVMTSCKTSNPGTTATPKPPRRSLLTETELANISKEKDALQKQIDKLNVDIQKIKKRTSGEALDRLLIPVELIEKSIQKEESLLKAFGTEPDSDDIAAMRERLNAKSNRLESLVKQYAALDKAILQLNAKIERLQKDIEDIKSKHTGSALEELIVPIAQLDQTIADEKALLLSYDKDPTEEELNALMERLSLIDQQLDKVRTSYRYTKDLDIQIKAGTLFESGQAVLTEKGEKQMNTVAKYIQKSIERYHKKFPEDTLRMVFKVQGYADEQPFYEGQPVEERQQQNRSISQKRAELVGNFIIRQINDDLLYIEKVFEGMGEALPPGVEAGNADDPNRRICTLSIFMLSEITP